jgi:tetrahydromethanopterin S-methyltransferase subunit F
VELSLMRSRKGAFLFEALIAVAIVAIAMSGLAISLNRCAEASQALGRDSRLRTALENRLSELAIGSLSAGTNTFSAQNGTVEVAESIQPSSLRGRDREMLTGLYEVHLEAKLVNESWPPLQVTRVIFTP